MVSLIFTWITRKSSSTYGAVVRNPLLLTEQLFEALVAQIVVVEWRGEIYLLLPSYSIAILLIQFYLIMDSSGRSVIQKLDLEFSFDYF